MAKFEWSEVFMSVEGEATYTGYPTVYVRFARCNFQCRGFNNPENLDTTQVDVIGFDPKQYSTLNEIPIIKRGCDSIYSWDEKFSHMWHVGDENQLANEVVRVLPHNSWVNPKSGRSVILSLTGGEPTLRIKFWPALLNTEQFVGVKHLLIETNCSVPLKEKHVHDLYLWAVDNDARVTWSNSPKIGRSGEKWEDAIRPEIARTQMFGPLTYRWKSDTEPMHPLVYDRQVFEQYFKFVCGPNEKDFEEVAKAMNEYYKVGISKQTPVFVMPEACLEEQQQQIAAQVAKMCIDWGYIYCHRVQNSVFGNGVGT